MLLNDVPVRGNRFDDDLERISVMMTDSNSAPFQRVYLCFARRS